MTGLGIVHAPMLREKNGARRARKCESLVLREREVDPCTLHTSCLSISGHVVTRYLCKIYSNDTIDGQKLRGIIIVSFVILIHSEKLDIFAF